MDALASYLARRKTIYYLTGPPLPFGFHRVPPDRWMLRQAIAKADELLVPSMYVRDIVRHYYNRDSIVAPVPINLSEFHPPNSRVKTRPVLLAMAAFEERRKGVRVLVRAFAELKRNVTGAVLRLSGPAGPALRAELEASVPPAVWRDIEFLETGELSDVPKLYAGASLTVVPAMWESYSMVFLESWAHGVPVVGANHAALPELLEDDRLGVLFDPDSTGEETQNVRGLAEAIERGLALSERPDVSGFCRSKAEQYCWSRIGTRFEDIYASVLGR